MDVKRGCNDLGILYRVKISILFVSFAGSLAGWWSVLSNELIMSWWSDLYFWYVSFSVLIKVIIYRSIFMKMIVILVEILLWFWYNSLCTYEWRIDFASWRMYLWYSPLMPMKRVQSMYWYIWSRMLMFVWGDRHWLRSRFPSE